MYLTYKDALKFLGLIVLAVELFMMIMLAEQGGFIPTSSQGDIHQHSEFSLHVSANGETIYTAAENVSSGLRNVLTSTTYPSPEAAMEAVEPVSGNPAYAHAVNVCWHEDYAKISLETGGGRHRTWWRKDYNGYRYTTTSHDILTTNGYQSVALYKYRVDKSYC